MKQFCVWLYIRNLQEKGHVCPCYYWTTEPAILYEETHLFALLWYFQLKFAKHAANNAFSLKVILMHKLSFYT